jgi:O-methyltransferase
MSSEPTSQPPGEISYENFVFSGSMTPREARATAPGPDADRLRTAYLELLKLSLVDLAGTTTVSVWQDERGPVMSRTLPEGDRQVRALGIDWPQQGLTMGGLHRLDDLQRCVESVVADDVPGDVIEAGTWRGGSSILMRATLDALGASDRTVWVADSFAGFPPEDAGEERRYAAIDFLAISLEEVQANFARLGFDEGVRFVPGFFADTMPGLADRSWSVVRLDGDTHDATKTTLEWLYPGLAPGGWLVIDDYGALPECRQAVDDYRAAHGIEEPIEQVDWTCVRWRRTDERPIERPAAPAGGTPAAPPPALNRAAGEVAYVPSMQEVSLQAELEGFRAHASALEAKLAATETELARLHAHPLMRAVAQVRRRLHR